MSLEIKYAEFIGSFPSVNQCPKPQFPEYAFIGRSNVGKSSLINMLTGKKGLAKVSNTPGKTQTLNYFQINGKWNLVDLPGYGYAKISKTKRAAWEKMIAGFLQNRANLMCAFVLLDAYIPPQLIDMEFINWLGEMHIPFVIVYTKVDRIRGGEEGRNKNIKAIQDELLKYWNDLPQQFISSSNNKTGQEEILNFIEGLNEQF
ncbi:MAG: ribosome biogenesis GTP-binding protein YihA/YsxC [Saprospiraceae bacterium]